MGGVSSVKLDGVGSLLFTETNLRRIRTMALGDGVLRLAAGVAWSTSPGDGGPANEGVLLIPSGVAADSAGNIYVADSLDNRVRKIDSETSSINTFGGNGGLGSTGDGGAAILQRIWSAARSH